MTFLTVIFAILFFSVIIFIHEFGHFISARIFGVTVHEFAVGMGPKLWSKEGKTGTKYSVRAIPIGGFCQMEGEDGDSEEEGSFSKKSKFARFVILASGAFMNIILGFIIALFVVSFTARGGIATTTVEKVVPEAPASSYIKEGDIITEINGHSVNIHQEISTSLSFSENNTFDITIKRDGEKKTFEDIELYDYEFEGETYKMIGITSKIKPPTFFGVLRESFFQTVYMGKIVFLSLGMLISGEASLGDLSGPVGVIDQMENAVTSSGGGLLGFINLLFLAGFISVNIGIMNLLPFPALDGGRIFFILIELIIRRRVPPEKEGIVHFIGLILLLGLMVFATWNDILRIIG
ncbi:MAG: site-2 protease family protein [Clostridia bacterium]|nr:site-2 protease family protein [Clostridia bacterium]